MTRSRRTRRDALALEGYTSMRDPMTTVRSSGSPKYSAASAVVTMIITDQKINDTTPYTLSGLIGIG
ncbi:hypothetical protein MSIMFI_04586 [Mycobacterium simulans]|uniref:hypothetical protein n=1 Tax=Mycobacterium simulans TaxID=627089 RepID=UPI00174DED9E|nr:hypothetical protein [Mycobacterium simulans]SON63056.1 hypothetical protein MSIMFI_04586 [Mycobacterium simulans]